MEKIQKAILHPKYHERLQKKKFHSLSSSPSYSSLRQTLSPVTKSKNISLATRVLILTKKPIPQKTIQSLQEIIEYHGQSSPSRESKSKFNLYKEVLKESKFINEKYTVIDKKLKKTCKVLRYYVRLKRHYIIMAINSSTIDDMVKIILKDLKSCISPTDTVIKKLFDMYSKPLEHINKKSFLRFVKSYIIRINERGIFKAKTQMEHIFYEFCNENQVMYISEFKKALLFFSKMIIDDYKKDDFQKLDALCERVRNLPDTLLVRKKKKLVKFPIASDLRKKLY